jgi:hypothetical protein
MELNSKSQIPNPKQAPSTNYPMTKTKKKIPQCLCLGHWNLELGIYLGFGAWNLEFNQWRDR